ELPRVVLELSPPVRRTVPLVSRVALWRKRMLFRSEMRVNVPVEGSYNSEDAVGMALETPPATRTFPLLSRVAVKRSRERFILPDVLKELLLGSKISAAET